MHGQRTYENRAMAKSTKYATLASSGRAVLSERIMVYKKTDSVVSFSINRFTQMGGAM